ncbi:hypothetical protein [Paraburkholderia sp. J67]|uniref:hypothetical protein n=1 Tax=Paraburkholderia sp. J67 TaxID=2805435 RepID=UPI002ABD6EE8|nr:hypothetical protein [Paraburkholderia sp. J67]
MNEFDFAHRRPMSYRAALRALPPTLHRRWWAMRWQFERPRVEISRLYAAPFQV